MSTKNMRKNPGLNVLSYATLLPLVRKSSKNKLTLFEFFNNYPKKYIYIYVFVELIDKAFGYHEKLSLCYLKRASNGKPLYKENFTYSRKCGSTEFKCPPSECRECMQTGYTRELLGL